MVNPIHCDTVTSYFALIGFQVHKFSFWDFHIKLCYNFSKPKIKATSRWILVTKTQEHWPFLSEINKYRHIGIA